MLREAMPARREARRILIGTIFSALGRGFTLPFLFIYLTKVRDVPASTAGLLIGWFGLLTLFAAPVGGTLIDRFGARRVVLPALTIEATAMGLLAFASTEWHFWGVLTLGALAGSSIWAGQNTILTSVTGDAERQKVFGLQFALLNLGIGVGAAISGSIVDIERLSTFQLIYLLDLCCYLAPVVVLLSMPRVGRRLVDPVQPAPGGADAVRPPGYREVLRHKPFRRLLGFSLLLTVSGYAQLEVGFSGFAVNVVGVTPRIIGYAFTANTVVIVLAQLFVIKKITGRSRSTALALVGAVFAVSWMVLGVAGLIDGASAVASALSVITFAAVFAFGETLLSPTMPTMVNALATDELRGRYNALAGMIWGISGVIAPISAGPLLQLGLGGLWIGLVIAGCLSASMIALSLRRLVTPHQDGTAQEPQLTEPIDSAHINSRRINAVKDAATSDEKPVRAAAG
ncbi:MAG TPA: MFS transporter [Candidatus Limnocylindrales bacterium]|nr:MFS transporter [Candidatus Limnocylindrales bacterium]